MIRITLIAILGFVGQIVVAQDESPIAPPPATWGELLEEARALANNWIEKTAEDSRLARMIAAREQEGLHPAELRANDFIVAALGERRASQQVPLLIARIDQKSQLSAAPAAGGQWPLHAIATSEYPAYAALVRIGVPACTAALDELPREEKLERRRLFVRLLVEVMSPSAATALLIERAEKTTDLKQRQRLLDAVVAVKASQSTPANDE